MKHIRFLALGLCVAGLSACKTIDGVVKDFESIKLPSFNSSEPVTGELVYDGQCPRVEAVGELKTLTEFSDVNDYSDYNLISRVDIGDIQNACSYDEKSVTIDLKMAFNGQLGPKGHNTGERPFFSYPFFVAVTSAGGDILAKEIFAASLTYDSGQDRQTYYEKMRQIIPIENRDRGSRYKILVGFQLTPDQLAYNREEIRKEAAAKEAAMKAQEQLAKDAQAQGMSSAEKMSLETQEHSNKISRPVTITP